MSNKTSKNIENSDNLLKILSHKDIKLKKPIYTSSLGFSNYIRALLQNWRQGTVGCKDRSEVAYSNKKPWKQKGTGRARAGTRRSPLWIGGGIIFGPQPRVRKLKVNKNQKRLVLNDLCWNLLDNQNILILDWQPSDKPKTAEVYNLLKKLNLHEVKINLLVDANDLLTQASFANLSNVNLILLDEANAYYLASGNKLVLLNKDLNKFKEMVTQWT